MNSRLLAVLIIFPIWIMLILVFRRQRQWLFYYLVAAFGLTIQLVFLAEYFGIDQLLVNVASFHVSLISKIFYHIPIELLSNGRFELLYLDGSSSILKLGIECSAVLESSVIFSLIVFYPLFDFKQKILRATFGLVITYVINIFRLMVIVLMAYKFGPDYIFVAHAGVARAFFFVFELLLYWYLITKPTVKTVGDAITDGKSLAEVSRVGRSLKLQHAIIQGAVIFLVVITSVASFGLSSDWHKAFVKVTPPKRPLIYKDETSIEVVPAPQEESGIKKYCVLPDYAKILGVFTERQLIQTNSLKPNKEAIYQLQFTDYKLINMSMSSGNQPVMIEVSIDNQFVNRTILVPQKNKKINVDQVFADLLKLNSGKTLEITIKNMGKSSAKYTLEIEGYSL